MGKIIQVNVSDKDLEDIDSLIQTKKLQDYNGNYLTRRSAVASYLINLGIRVIKSSNEKENFNINEYRKELFKRVLQNIQLSKAIIEILNELPEFKERFLLNEFFNENSQSLSFIKKEMNELGFINEDTWWT